MPQIPFELTGDVWPAVIPGAEAGALGSARLEAPAAVEVRSFQTCRIVYTAGRYGLDDTGGVRIAHFFTYDGGALQTEDPTAANYVTAVASGDAKLSLLWEPYGLRPWDKALRVTVTGGYVRPGETITVTYGDVSGGGPGFRMQTFCETGFRFRVSVDACATGQFSPIDDALELAIAPGAAHRWKVVLPTLRRPGREFPAGPEGRGPLGQPERPGGAPSAVGAERAGRRAAGVHRFPDRAARCRDLRAPLRRARRAADKSAR